MHKFFLRWVLLIMVCTVVSHLNAQDTLPKFKAVYLGKEKVQISWVNPYSKCIQLAIQRSYDSLKFFKTIFSAQSPELPQNGFIDNTAVPGVSVYYRIFYVLEGGEYFFTKSKQPLKQLNNPFNKPNKIVINDTPEEEEKKVDTIKIVPVEIKQKPIPIIRYITIYRNSKDTFQDCLEYKNLKRFKDSMSYRTRDTLQFLVNDEIIIKKFKPKYVWKPSVYVFTNDDGYAVIKLNDVALHKYRILFYDEDGTEMFEIKQIKDPYLVLDKTNFHHAGWFTFELFQDEKVKEKNKFYIFKDF